MKKNRKRYNGNTNRRYDINSNIDYRTFNDWDILEHRTGGTSTLQAEIEALQNSDSQQNTQLKEQSDKLDQQSTLIDQQGILIDTKQDKLIAGDNITIENNIISATGSTEEKHLYAHYCRFYYSTKYVFENFNFVYYTSDPSTSPIDFLKSSGYALSSLSDHTSKIIFYPASGAYYNSNDGTTVTEKKPIVGVSTYQDDTGTYLAYVMLNPNATSIYYAYQQAYTRYGSYSDSLYHNVVQIF